MKKFFGALGKAVCYLLLYLSTQVAVTLAAGIVYGAKLGMEYAATGNGLNIGAVDAAVAGFLEQYGPSILLFSNLLSILAAAAWFALRKRSIKEAVSLRPLPPARLLPVLLLSVCLSVCVCFGLPLLPFSQESMSAYEALSGSTIQGGVLGVLSVVVLGPIAEEVTFRGLVYTRLKSGMPLWLAFLLECLVFGLLHGTAVWILYATFMGAVMTLIFECTGSLYASICLHMAFNLLGGYILPYLPVSAGAELPLTLVFGAASVLLTVFIVRGNKKQQRTDQI